MRSSSTFLAGELMSSCAGPPRSDKSSWPSHTISTSSITKDCPLGHPPIMWIHDNGPYPLAYTQLYCNETTLRLLLSMRPPHTAIRLETVTGLPGPYFKIEIISGCSLALLAVKGLLALTGSTD